MTITNLDIYAICDLASSAREGHIGSSLGILDILSVVYAKKGHDDAFILSKGHASLGLYYILFKYGHIRLEVLKTFCEMNSPLGGHPDFRKVPTIFGSTGSLGHGLPLAVGKALGIRINGGTGRVVVLIGDGELNEGSNWESFLLAVHHSLCNLICIVDYNQSSERALSVRRAPGAISALGWSVYEVDGHDQRAIEDAMSIKSDIAPTLIWANTVKGKGISFMENNPEWHHKSPNSHDLQRIREELNLA